tara:strand:- start:1188 stop:1433 length:246 start_codon:yes stop_codon:yes gene_type:complete
MKIMEIININPSKSQTKEIKNDEVRASLWANCVDSLPVIFNNPDKVCNASKLQSVLFSDGTHAYRLKVPVFGGWHFTYWRK